MLNTFTQVDNPVQDDTYRIESGEAIQGVFRCGCFDLFTQYFRHDESTVSGNSSCPTQGRASLFAVEYLRNGTEGRTVTDTSGGEQQQEQQERQGQRVELGPQEL